VIPASRQEDRGTLEQKGEGQVTGKGTKKEHMSQKEANETLVVPVSEPSKRRRKKERTPGEIAEHLRQKTALAARHLPSLTEQLSVMSYKERLLSERARRVFAQLGPSALASMQVAVKIGSRASKTRQEKEAMSTGREMAATTTSKSETKSDQPKWLPRALKTVPTLRAFERFMTRVSKIPGCAAYFRLVPLPPGETLVPAEICQNDRHFHNTIAVFPCHIFSSMRRMVAVHQKKYVDANGRRVPLFGWPFPTTICQAICFAWLIGEGILQRFRKVGAPPPVPQTSKSAQEKATNVENIIKPLPNKPKKQKRTVKFDMAALRMQRLSAGSELYQYNFVSYISAPPDEGASATNPRLQLKPFEATRAAVRRHYECALAKLIYVSRSRDEPVSNWLEVDMLDPTIPVLTYVPAVHDETENPKAARWVPVSTDGARSIWVENPSAQSPRREVSAFDDGFEWWMGAVRPKRRVEPDKPIPRARKRQRVGSKEVEPEPAIVNAPVDPPPLMMTAPTLFKCDGDGLPLFLFPDFKVDAEAIPQAMPTWLMPPPLRPLGHPRATALSLCQAQAPVQAQMTETSQRVKPLSVLEAMDETEILPGEWNAPLLVAE
jgi:hypothetical protein